MTHHEVNYFAHATNADLDMIGAITGTSDYNGKKAKLHGYELCIQKLNHIRNQIPAGCPLPISPRQVIERGFGKDFELYVLRPNPNASVGGVIFRFNEFQKECLRDWELIDCGMMEDIYATAITEDGESVEVWTHGLNTPPFDVDRVVHGDDFQKFIAPKEAMIREATRVHNEFLQRWNETH